MKRIPVVKRKYLSDGSFLTSLVGSSKSGSKKLQFPYEIPTINFSVDLPKQTSRTLLGVAGIFAGGLILSAIIKH